LSYQNDALEESDFLAVPQAKHPKFKGAVVAIPGRRKVKMGQKLKMCFFHS
jgi:hypothetical protein